jgi:hypothetical protein
MGGIPASRRPTVLLEACAQGDQTAFDELLRLVHNELRRLAHRH